MYNLVIYYVKYVQSLFYCLLNNITFFVDIKNFVSSPDSFGSVVLKGDGTVRRGVFRFFMLTESLSMRNDGKKKKSIKKYSIRFCMHDKTVMLCMKYVRNVFINRLLFTPTRRKFIPDASSSKIVL